MTRVPGDSRSPDKPIIHELRAPATIPAATIRATPNLPNSADKQAERQLGKSPFQRR